MAIFRKVLGWKRKLNPKRLKNYKTPLVPKSGGFYDSSITGKRYDEYLESPENRRVAGISVYQMD